MSLSNGRPYLAIPGPSVIPDEVLQAMHRPSPNIYEGELIEITQSLIPDLKQVAKTNSNVAIYIANGHGAWEAALANMVEAGDHILVAATGRFAHGWAEMAENLGVKVKIIEFGKQSPIDARVIEETLRADKQKKFKALLTTHVDTSTSVKNDIAGLRKALDAADHPALLATDCIASLGCDDFQMDSWGVDVMVTGCQKGLMVPPGLSFVYFSERAKKLQKMLTQVSSYWNWAPRIEPNGYYEYFCGTAPTNHIYGLRKALDIILSEGMTSVLARHAVLAKAVWTAVERWGQDGGLLKMNISKPQDRSHAVTALSIGAPDAKRLRHWVEKNAGLTLGIGLGMASEEDPNGDGFFRLGHMGYVNAQMIMGMLGTIETGLIALDIPHGSGACEAAAKKLALSVKTSNFEGLR